MSSNKAYLKHLQGPEDLVTSYEATRTGFLEMALEKNKAANPFVEQAKILKSIASETKDPFELLSKTSIQNALISAAGFSDKATKYINPQDYESILSEFVKKILIPAGNSYVDELVYRYLLTKGDSIGGSLRNLVGKIGQKKVVNSIVAALTLYKLNFSLLSNSNHKWQKPTDLNSESADNISGIFWESQTKKRTLMFNQNVPIVDNNIDMVLLSCNYDQAKTVIERSPESFLALGELKGGIDPAGADEHWKTARSAFTRIRNSFSKAELFPEVFFIGGAIEKKMSTEIWGFLETNIINNAANLTNSNQLSSLTTWLVNK